MKNSNGKRFVLPAVAVFLAIFGLLSVGSFVSAANTVMSTDSVGNEKNEFNPNENVYVMLSAMRPENRYEIYIFENQAWVKGTTALPSTYKSMITITTKADGSYGPTLVWKTPLAPGYYDIVANCLDAGDPGKYDDPDEIDDISIKGAGLFVVTEFAPILAVVACYAATFAVMMFKRRRSSQPHRFKSYVNNEG